MTLTIPTSVDYPTLNLSHAAAIIFYELYPTMPARNGDKLAEESVKRAILHYLSLSANRAGVEEYKIGMMTRALRNILGRSAVRRREGSLLAGAFRQIWEKMSRSDSPLGQKEFQNTVMGTVVVGEPEHLTEK